MRSWLIILITVSVGLILFGIIFFIKKKKNQRRSRNPVMFTNTAVVPSTNHAPAYNMGASPTMYQYQTVTAQQVYPIQQHPPGYNVQMYPPTQGQQQFYPPAHGQAPTAPAMPMPSAPNRY